MMEKVARAKEKGRTMAIPPNAGLAKFEASGSDEEMMTQDDFVGYCL